MGNPGLVPARPLMPTFPDLTLCAARADDIAAIMAIERLPGYEGFVGRSEEAEHRTMLGSPSYAYRLGVDATGAIEAFAILRGLDDPHGGLYLKRVVAARPGRGLGVGFLSLLLDEAFGELKAHRFWLDCFADNARAQRAYGKLGFAREGVLREAYRLPDGSRKDLVVMGLLKPEWQARRTACSFESESVISIR